MITNKAESERRMRPRAGDRCCDALESTKKGCNNFQPVKQDIDQQPKKKRNEKKE